MRNRKRPGAPFFEKYEVCQTLLIIHYIKVARNTVYSQYIQSIEIEQKLDFARGFSYLDMEMFSCMFLNNSFFNRYFLICLSGICNYGNEY